MDLRELLEARQGRPTEDEAARKIATFAVIPAAITGLLVGTQLVGLADPVSRLLWVCTATALDLVWRSPAWSWGSIPCLASGPVVVLADALLGGFVGLLCGGTLALVPHVAQACPP